MYVYKEEGLITFLYKVVHMEHRRAQDEITYRVFFFWSFWLDKLLIYGSFSTRTIEKFKFDKLKKKKNIFFMFTNF